ncbi:hypothetical protein BDV96DRAFT_641694 [Lophiotrema nucula]|uniref:DUF3431 domain containing protein n=1 Tax=Lophiotrema nucula TaxID=690887 RepID=A0A6A5ZKY5_9PLEO|nr:hypothetical protein BDV96DRAFT_641694 [Lophiotrema nucula]
MFTLQRKVFWLSIIAALFILAIVHFRFQPLTPEAFKLLINNGQQPDKLLGNIPKPSISSSSTSETHLQPQIFTSPTPAAHGGSLDTVLVVARLRTEDVSWIDRSLPGWKTAIYTVDDPDAALHTSRNKGHEANVYLTYIVDNYAKLPDVMVFIHSHQKHKHGTRAFEGIDYDNVATLKALKLDFVKRAGYANLRCLTNPGCPAEIQPFRPDEERDPLRPQENAMAGAWTELFENDNVPRVLATPCCAQFAVSRETVLQRSKEEYEKFLMWLHTTPLDDFTSGRIFEYLWHVIFGRDPVHCPDMDQCYKDQYGTTSSVVHQEQEKHEQEQKQKEQQEKEQKGKEQKEKENKQQQGKQGS